MGKQILILGSVWPEPGTTAAGHRMKQLLEAFLEFGHCICFASTASPTKHSLNLESMGIRSVPIRLNHPSFDAFLHKLDPQWVVFDRFMVEEQFGWRVAQHAPRALRILNTEDLHSLRKAREEALRQGAMFDLDRWRDHPMTLREGASILRSDCSLIISSHEMDLLGKRLGIPGSLLLHLPFMVDPIGPDRVEKWPDHKSRNHFVHIGNGRHLPNVDSLQILKSRIWPLIKGRLPHAELHVYGAYLPKKVLQMHDPATGFYVEGWTGDLQGTLQNARVMLAPLRFGAGIKGKLLDAMLHGTPTVTTPTGAEGMQGELPWNGAVEDQWEAFAQTAVQLYQNRTHWERAQAHGIVLVKAHFEKRKYQDVLRSHLEGLEANLEEHRRQNFMGRILQQELHSSTKYMAKWIEAKNGL